MKETNKLRVLVVIPCFNEQSSIINLLGDIKSVHIQGVEITPLPVNDCSTYDTFNEIKSFTNTYLDLTVNLGIGGAVQAGYKFAKLNNYDVAVQMDGDGQHPVS